MSNQINKDEIFRRFLDGELSADEERNALHMIAEDEEMRDMLLFERSLYQTAGKEMDSESFTIPEDFTDRVMLEIAGLETGDVPSQSLINKLKEMMELLFAPRQIQFRPVVAMTALMILALLLAVPTGEDVDMERIAGVDQHERSVQVISEREQEVWIRFIYFDEQAETVSVAGDFSDWDPVSLDKEIVDGKQVWSGMISVPRGEQRYMFIKDGEEWVTDPLAEMQRDDGFGNKNAVLYL